MIKCDLFVSPIKIKLFFFVERCWFSVFTFLQHEELMEWHTSLVPRTRIRVIGVNFSDFLIKRKES